MEPIKIALVSSEKDGLSLYHKLKALKNIEVTWVMNNDQNINQFLPIKGSFTTLSDFLKEPYVDIIINTTDQPEVNQIIQSKIQPQTSLIYGQATNFIKYLLNEKCPLLQIKETVENIYSKISQIESDDKLNISLEKSKKLSSLDILSIDKMEQIMLKQALAKYGSSVEGKKQAAKALNISLATLYNKIKKYRIS